METIGALGILAVAVFSLILLVLAVLMPIFVYSISVNTKRMAADLSKANQLLTNIRSELADVRLTRESGQPEHASRPKQRPPATANESGRYVIE